METKEIPKVHCDLKHSLKEVGFEALSLFSDFLLSSRVLPLSLPRCIQALQFQHVL